MGASQEPTTAVDPAVAGIDADELARFRLSLFRLVRNIRSNSVDDVTPSQLAVLSSLTRHGPSTIGQLAEHEHVQPPSVSKIVSALDARGFIERTTDPNDRRCTTIALTPAATEYLDAARAAGKTWLAERISTLSTGDAEQLRAAIPVLEQLLAGVE